MDREPEQLQFVGIFGIYKEAYKITVSWKKIFSQITLCLILPLSFIFLAQNQISELLVAKIQSNAHTLQETQKGNPMYDKTHAPMSSELITFLIIDVVYLLFLLVLSLLSTSAIVYTIACIYTSKKITFKKVISVVPKVWKRLMITFLWNFFIMFLYNFFAILLITLFGFLFGVLLVMFSKIEPGKVMIFFWVVLIILLIPYFIGFVYISVVWHIASVISVLEENYGIKAMKKSKNLIKGKIWIASAFLFKFQICFSVVLMGFKKLVVHGESMGMVGRVSFGILCLLLLAILVHFALIIQTIIYFVCKSYHNENIDKSSLADHLDVYHQGDYVPLIREDKDVQFGLFSV